MRRLGTLGVIAIPYVLLVGIGLLSGSSALLIQLDSTVRFWGAALILGATGILGLNVFERLLSGMAPAPKPWWRRLLLVWIIVLLLLGAINLIGVYFLSERAWVSLKLFGLTGGFWITGLVLVFLHFMQGARI